ncbi:unnamed protein product [Echinostoma caproni]|uniref:F-box domain-containing protein n=1 Tax=Echinostoma caproni TaxID=27848 RepID=A0A183AKB4_9TREM|nr:unnamed protein product [Echinostoma caproni]
MVPPASSVLHIITISGILFFQSCCDRLVQRSKANSHFRFHSDFLVPLNDSIELRCPLHHLGCDFIATRMLPHFSDTSTVPPPDASDGDTHLTSNVDTLPPEIMLHLGQFLDDVSLYCFSQTSDRLHALLTPVLRQRMVVTPHWKRCIRSSYSSSGWQIDRFVWSLPYRTDEILEWRWSSAGAEMAAHLKICPFNDVVVQAEPFCLTNGTRIPF